jgi:Protein of unknown function (DUF3455)
MKHSHAHADQTTRRILLLACVTALTGVLMAAIQPADAHRDLVSPPVPLNLEVSADNKLFLVGHAVGTQQYICLPSGSSFAWTLFGPQATLFKDDTKQIITHFLSPNPDESGMPRATWQHSNDTSAVWAMAIASSSDPNFVALDAIPWLLLEVSWGSKGAHRRCEANADGFYPATEHLRRGRANDRLFRIKRHWHEGTSALHGRLLLLQEHPTRARRRRLKV